MPNASPLPAGSVTASRQLAAQLRRLVMLDDGDDIVPWRQQRLLSAVGDRPGVRLKDLAAAVEMGEGNCHRMVARALRDGYLTKTRGSTGREIALSLTREGRTVLRQIDTRLAKRLRRHMQSEDVDALHSHLGQPG